MELYLLKCTGCLLVFWAAYVLLLEKQKMHHFKRFYLLGIFVASAIIPLLTLTFYVEATPEITYYEQNEFVIPPTFSTEIATVTEPTNYLTTILYIIYGIGIALFLARFIINLRKLYQQISENELIKYRPFIYVLLQEYHIPHSFFKYLFFSKSKFETGEIPKEVILHEETHAKQLHSLDIMAVELLQIVFWFHPLVYVLKHHIKLNQEFLADQAVLEQGADTKNYQHILLQFSSNSLDNQLTSAINYSSIKKRFTVMKKNTSKKAVWLRSLLVLPLVTLLVYSFSEKEVLEVEFPAENDFITNIESEVDKANNLELNFTQDEVFAISENIEIYINENGKLFLQNKEVKLESLKESIQKYNADFTFEERKKQVVIKLTFETKIEASLLFRLREILDEYGYVSLETKGAELEVHPNKTEKELKNSNTPETGFVEINNTFYFFVVKKNKRHFYNMEGFETDNLGNIISKTRVNASDVIPEHYITKVYKDDKIIASFKDNWSETQKDKNFNTAIDPSGRNQEGATKEQISEYNAIASKYSGLNSRPMQKTDIDRMNYLYGLMKVEQKKSVANFPEIPPMPEPPMPPLPPSLDEINRDMQLQERALQQQEVKLAKQGKALRQQVVALTKQEKALRQQEVALAKQEKELQKQKRELKNSPIINQQ